MVGVIFTLGLAGCTTDPGVSAPGETETTEAEGEWFDQALFNKQYDERGVTPGGPADEPYLQQRRTMVDTSEFASDGAKKGWLRERLPVESVAPDWLDHHQRAAQGVAGFQCDQRTGDT